MVMLLAGLGQDVNGMKRKIGANTRSIKKVRLDVKSLSSRVENLERHGARDSATASSEIMEKVLSWTNLVRNSMYRALGQIRVVGFTPTSKPSAEKLANMFLDKLFRFKQGGPPPLTSADLWDLNRRAKIGQSS